MLIKINKSIYDLGQDLEFVNLKSKFTNKDLISFETSILIDSSSEELKDYLINSDERRAIEVDELGNKKGEFEVDLKSYSIGTNAPSNFYLEFVELEHNEIKKLKIDDLEFKPYSYVEEYDEISETIFIEASVRVNKSDFEKILDLNQKEYQNEYFDVVREGISSNILRMRFGQNIWSKEEDLYKVRIILVEENYDKALDNSLNVASIQNDNIKLMLSNVMDFNKALIELLINKGVASKEEIEALKDNINRQDKRIMYEFNEVDDIDKFNK